MEAKQRQRTPPRTPQQADRHNPLTAGLRLLYSPVSPGVTTPVNGPTFSSGKPGLGRKFTAASAQYVNAGNRIPFTLGNEITLLCWYRLDSQPASNNGFSLVAKDADTGGRAYTLDVYNAASSGLAGVRLYVNGGGSVGTNEAVEGRTPLAGDERLAIVTRSVASSNTSVYIDGVLASTTTATTATPSATADLRIGARQYLSFEDYLNGAIYLAAVWDRVLSASEVAKLAKNPWQLYAKHDQDIYAKAPAGVGSVAASAGTASVSGIGASVATTAGASNGVGAASGVGASSVTTVGSSSGIGAASGVGLGATNSVGSSTGAGAVSGVGASVSNSVGSSSGIATASGIAPVEAGSGVASSAGVATAGGIGASIVAAVGASSGSASVSGISGNGVIIAPEETSYAPQRKVRAPNFAPRKEPAKPEAKKKPKAKVEPKPEKPSINRLRVVNDLMAADSMFEFMEKQRQQQAIERQRMYNIRARAALLAA